MKMRQGSKEGEHEWKRWPGDEARSLLEMQTGGVERGAVAYFWSDKGIRQAHGAFRLSLLWSEFDEITHFSMDGFVMNFFFSFEVGLSNLSIYCFSLFVKASLLFSVVTASWPKSESMGIMQWVTHKKVKFCIFKKRRTRGGRKRLRVPSPRSTIT